LKRSQPSMARSLAAAGAATVAGMFLFELCKQLLFPHITIWVSHFVTISFTTVLTVLAAYFVSRKLAALTVTLKADIAERTRLEQLRREAEEELKLSEANFRSLVQNAPFGICRSSAGSDRFLMANPALVRILGYTSEQDLLNLHLSEDVQLQHGKLGLLADEASQSDRFEVVADWKRSDATPIKVRITGRKVSEPQNGGDLLEAIVEEITDRFTLEEQLRQAQKMEAIGRLAGGVAHDFNNLLGVILGHTELLVPLVEQENPLYWHAQAIRRAAEHAASLTAQLLAFGRRQILQVSVIDLNAVVGNVGAMVRRLVGEDIAVRTHLGSDLGKVKADPVQLQQVILNLAANARDAMPQGGTITIETANAELDAEYEKQHKDASCGPWVMLAISDTGMGMDQETKARIFEPFFTTKGVQQGTGLGLASVYGIVKQCGGLIYVYSEPGKGTTFKIYLPQVQETIEKESGFQPVVPEPKEGSETILLVEDAGELRILTRQFLEFFGYSVLEAENAVAAVQKSKSHQGTIHLLITDVVLPGDSGPKLAASLASSRPEMRVLYISGYTENAIVHHGLLDPGITLLQKPYSRDALVRKVRDVLDSTIASSINPR
jgi:two-component system cell cycle sensor histidine kinase/response regulator CckA